MTCQHCCGAEAVFDNKTAKKNAIRYKRKGPNKTTKRLLQILSPLTNTTSSLLDIGGGVGVIQHEFIKLTNGNTTDVDASLEYIEQAKKIAEENDTKDQMCFIYADFVDIHSTVEVHDIVTMEKVVCCYPDIDKLLIESTAKADQYFAFVYPIKNILSQTFFFTGNLYMTIKKNPFRIFLHDEKKMIKSIEDQGFELLKKSNVFPWKIAVLKRIK